MAIDTRQKRASALRVGRPWIATMPPADGTVDFVDRRQLGFSYSGYASIAIVIPGVSNLCIDVIAVTQLGLTVGMVQELAFDVTMPTELELESRC
jgi:hypothetical protein